MRQALQGNIYVSEPLVSKITGQLSIMVAAPLYAEEAYGSSVAGVVYFVPQETFLNDIVTAIQIGDNSRAYMINKTGDTIADITLETITVQNIEAEAQSDPSLQELAAIHSEMRQGEKRIWYLYERRSSDVCGVRTRAGYGWMEHCGDGSAGQLSGFHTGRYHN